MPEVDDDELVDLLSDLAPRPPSLRHGVPSLSLPVDVLVLSVLAAVAGFFLGASWVGAVLSLPVVGAGIWLGRQVSQRAEAVAALRDWHAARHRAEARCAELGCGPTQDAVRRFRSDLLARRERAARAAADLRAWTSARAALGAESAHARDALVAAIRERGFPREDHDPDRCDDPEVLLDDYAACCRANAAQTRLSARRHDLAAALSARIASESVAEQARRAVSDVIRNLCAAADAVGVLGQTADELVEGLRGVASRRRGALADRDAAVRLAATREQLVAGQTPAEVTLAVESEGGVLERAVRA